jgi:hypothetical protein
MMRPTFSFDMKSGSGMAPVIADKKAVGGILVAVQRAEERQLSTSSTLNLSLPVDTDVTGGQRR